MEEIPGMPFTMTTTALSTPGEQGALEEDQRASGKRRVFASEREAS
jgi:hypothetical protein